VLPAIEKANQIDDRPVVIDFRIDPMEQVFPMVPAGASNSDVVVHPSQREPAPSQREPAPSGRVPSRGGRRAAADRSGTGGGSVASGGQA
ncbi:MAG: hypothetical protein ACRDZ5_11175, partial [Acidimicrobiales bacterium]